MEHAPMMSQPHASASHNDARISHDNTSAVSGLGPAGTRGYAHEMSDHHTNGHANGYANGHGPASANRQSNPFSYQPVPLHPHYGAGGTYTPSVGAPRSKLTPYLRGFALALGTAILIMGLVPGDLLRADSLEIVAYSMLWSVITLIFHFLLSTARQAPSWLFIIVDVGLVVATMIYGGIFARDAQLLSGHHYGRYRGSGRYSGSSRGRCAGVATCLFLLGLCHAVAAWVNTDRHLERAKMRVVEKEAEHVV